MATTTPNFGWPVPTSTDLVKDGATAIEALGDGVDASLVDLKGGTTGQILAKATNADMDFAWVTNDVGDITAITASSPITGGGTSGDVTIGILDGTTSNKGAVQLSTSTSSTSTSLAATASAVKSAYDLADAAIAKSIVDAKGDLISATADNTPARLAVGANNTSLVANSSAATGLEWQGGFTTWTPSFTGVTVGNGTTVARYNQIGKLVHAEFIFVLGSTSAVTGSINISLPVTAKVGATLAPAAGFAGSLLDAGTAIYDAIAVISSAGTLAELFAVNSAGTYANFAVTTGSVPFTWGISDAISFNITYEAA